jgi:Zn-dependent peptidase ImmA (M78 family)
MATRVSVEPRLLTWARRRSGRSEEELRSRFPKLDDWEAGEERPTIKQLEDFAAATYTPVGTLFLPEPPEEETVPIPDLRTVGDQRVRTPSPNLLDTIYDCERRQDWYRDFAERHGYDPVELVGIFTLATATDLAAVRLREELDFGLASRAEYRGWSEALSGLIARIENLGVLVMINGVVRSNTHRKLDPEEFRGFALVDPLAPVIFVNNADTKAAQIFTLAHELGHVLLGGSALSAPNLAELDEANETERWCNAVAAEFLVSAQSLRTEYVAGAPLAGELDRLARFYKVSTLVVLRRIRDIGLMPDREYWTAYRDEYARVMRLLERDSSGGNYYNTQPGRVSRRFARALIADTREGGTLYRDAFGLLGSRTGATFDQLGERLGVGG